MYSLPSNQVELWAELESDRMMHPVHARISTKNATS